MVLGDAKHSLEQLRAALEEPCLLPQPTPQPTPSLDPLTQAAQLAREAESVIIVPGYGLALAHAASDAVALGRRLEQMGKDVRYAVHPVAGRMPGHMHVLLAEAEVDYDKLYEMDAINPRFADTDLALIVGACDVVNPQAVQTEDTPISGMPILHADQARHVVVLNLDDKPGYSGVPNSLYTQPHTVMVLGDAKHSLEQLRAALEDGECAIDLPATG
jgi:NAD(P) transhydrogenase subunit beta